ncbi:MAG: hypothetical protein GX297_00220 [Treponema sp.]|nr:hypothetical protein [Treponema sp.]
MEKKLFFWVFISLFFILSVSIVSAEKMRKLVSDYADLPASVRFYKNNSRYWEFTVPQDFDYIVIDCSSNLGIKAVTVVPSKKDAFKFCDSREEFNYITYSETGEGEKFIRHIESISSTSPKLTPGKTYYFCIFGISSIWIPDAAANFIWVPDDAFNKILVEITARYVKDI